MDMGILFRISSLGLGMLVVIVACGSPEPLDQEKARALILARMFPEEPVYAEVPAEVWWNDRSPKDDFDEVALRTLRNLEEAGLVTVEDLGSSDEARWRSVRTPAGVRVLGTVPSARGPAWRAQIATKRIDRVESFERHPTRPHAGRAEVIWHYEEPTRLYDVFETKIEKPLDTPFASVVSINLVDGRWQLTTIIQKKPFDPSSRSSDTRRK